MRNMKGVFLVYDISNYDSFSNLKLWVEEIKNIVKSDCEIMILGNKNDLKD